MAGIQANLRYDECATIQAVSQSTKQFRDYDFLIDAHENSLKNNVVATCDGKFAHVECKLCDLNQGTMTNTRENVEYRTDLENDLYGLTRLNTDCDSQKFVPCYGQNCDKKCAERGNSTVNSCDKFKAVNQPLLCDRLVVPTNMKPYVGPFKYN
jgi:hypothetical protein